MRRREKLIDRLKQVPKIWIGHFRISRHYTNSFSAAKIATSFVLHFLL